LLRPQLNSLPVMRSARGQIPSQTKYFHVESMLSTKLEDIKQDEAHEYLKLVEALATIYGFQLQFWTIHNRGIGLLVKAIPLKTKGVSSTEIIAAYETIGEAEIANTINTTDPHKLDQPTRTRFARYKDNRGNIQRFAQTIKQRISIKYNRMRGRKGSVWQDRAKIFPLRNRTSDLVEVTGYLLTQTPLEATEKALSPWPSPLQQLRDGDSQTQHRLNQLFKSNHNRAELLKFLSNAHGKILTQIKSPTNSSRRGRTPAWRPECESALVNDHTQSTTTYHETKERAHARFHKMLERFKSFQNKTGLEAMPHGYKGDPELRKWAAALRGKFKQGRLPEWQLKQLKGNSILSAPLKKSEIHAT